MEEHLSSLCSGTSATPKEPEPPKSNETRIVEALESIAGELFRIRSQFESVTKDESESGIFGAAIRTTGR